MKQHTPGGVLDVEGRLVKAEVSSRLFSGGGRSVRLGRFELLRRLGRGGMGVVYEALDGERGERVAIKSLPRLEARAIYRLKREFRSLSELHDENLVPLYELFALGRRWFFSMELVCGEPFDAYVRPGGVLELSMLRVALPQLVRAVGVLHAAGKLHCDLKPGNVLVTKEGRLKVLDFGLCAESDALDSRSREDAVAGTPAYMAPEQALGFAPSEASDWYAVGVMLFEALAGRRPFEGRAPLLPSSAPPLPPARLPAGAPRPLQQLCGELLQRAPSQRPSGAEVMERVQAWCALPAAVVRPRPQPSRTRRSLPFVGRESELAVLDEALAAARAGRQRIVLVEGSSGMGKSALLARFGAQCAAEALVLQGRCYAQEWVPYKALDAVVDALGRALQRLAHEQAMAVMPRHVRALSRLFPSLERVAAVAQAPRPRDGGDAREQRGRAFEALKELLLRLCDRRPVVMLVDDLQWADVDSARLLSVLLGAPEPPPLLFVGAYRGDEWEHSEFLQQALAEGGALADVPAECRLALGPLEPDSAQRLAMELAGGALHARWAARLAHEAQGVPFLIRELVEHRRTRPGETPRVSDVVGDRVAALEPQARALLSVLAVAAAPTAREVALRAARLALDDRVALSQLRATHLVRTRGSGPQELAEPYHDRIREAVVAAMPDAAVALTHARLAHALELRGESEPERLVEHYAAAGELQRAGRAAVNAAGVARDQLAFNRAAELYRKAIALLPEEEVGCELHEALGDALANAGRGAQAAEAYLSAAERAEGAIRDQLRTRAARQYLRSGRLTEGQALAREMLRKQGVRVPRSNPETLRMLLWNRIALSAVKLTRTRASEKPTYAQQARLDAMALVVPELLVVDFLKGAAVHARHLREALRYGDSACRTHALAWEAYGAALVGGRSARRAQMALRAAETLARAEGDPRSEVFIGMAHAAARLFSGRAFDSAFKAAVTALDLIEKLEGGATWERGVARFMLFTAAEFAGPLKLIADRASEVSREARERDDDLAQFEMLLAFPCSRLMDDDRAGALRFLKDLEPRIGPEYSTFRHLWILRMAETLLYGAQPTAAYALLQDHHHAFRRSTQSRSEFVEQSFDFYWCRAAAGAFVMTGEVHYAEHGLALAARLCRRRTAYAGYGLSLAATIKAHAGQRGWLGHTVAAEKVLVEAEAPLGAMSARWASARLQDDRSGTDDALDFHRTQGVRAPERWLWSLCPAGPPPS